KAQVRLAADKAALALAPTYEALGKLELAEKNYQATLAVNPANPAALNNLAGFYTRTGKSVKAEPILRKILMVETKAPKAMAASARRSLALILAARGDVGRFQDALKLLDENTKEGHNAADHLTRALVMASRPDKRPDAIQLLQNMPPGQ